MAELDQCSAPFRHIIGFELDNVFRWIEALELSSLQHQDIVLRIVPSVTAERVFELVSPWFKRILCSYCISIALLTENGDDEFEPRIERGTIVIFVPLSGRQSTVQALLIEASNSAT